MPAGEGTSLGLHKVLRESTGPHLRRRTWYDDDGILRECSSPLKVEARAIDGERPITDREHLAGTKAASQLSWDACLSD